MVGVLLLAPLAIRGLGAVARATPIAARLALRDLARYQARSGAALGAATLAIGIAAIITVSVAAQVTKASAEGENLPADELVVYVSPDGRPGGTGPPAHRLRRDPGPARDHRRCHRPAAVGTTE